MAIIKIIIFIYSGEKTLKETAARRNEGGDPNKRARLGYKVDVLVVFNGLWKPTLSCGEISGGLPRCSPAKEWATTLKLALELRDVWKMAQNELKGVDATELVVWGFIVVGESRYSCSFHALSIFVTFCFCGLEHKLRIYALAAAGGFFHLVLTYEASMPSSMDDLWNIQITYLAMSALWTSMEAMWNTLCELNVRKVVLERSGQKRKTGPERQPEIVNSPIKAKKGRV